MSHAKSNPGVRFARTKKIASLALLAGISLGSVANAKDWAQQQEAARERAEQQRQAEEQREQQMQAQRERAEQQQRQAEERERQQEAARQQQEAARQYQQQQEAARQQEEAARQYQQQEAARQQQMQHQVDVQREAPIETAHQQYHPVENPKQERAIGQPYHGPDGRPDVQRQPQRLSPTVPVQSQADLADLQAQSAQLKLQLQLQILNDTDDLIQQIGDLLSQQTDAAAPADPSLADSVQDLLSNDSEIPPAADSSSPDQLADQVNDLLTSSTDPLTAPDGGGYTGSVADAQKAVYAGDFVRAFAAAMRAAMAKPDSYQAHYLAAYAAWKLNHVDNARAEAARALQLAPPNARIEAKVLVDAIQALTAPTR